MSKSLQDQFIDDDEEESCPLCVEEFDLTDKGFRPCECGYQICQFCYHNVKNNMNGLCPACRRPYDDNKIQYKVITPEETAAHKARQAQKAKKTQAAAQKEKAKAEADNMSRKHLAGLRVVQKNLVYVTGLSPTMQEDQLLQTLRGDQYFGQYGKIIKIVVSKAKDPSNPHSVGVYVTYERKEDAASCIAAVDGSKNGERTLRAQFGTTKYCSSYLRGENCLNRNCMFLHEPGEANESYSRAELSAHNAVSSQHGRSAPPQPQQPVASAAPPMARQVSNDQPNSPSTDRPALPSTASWASKPSHAGRAETRTPSIKTDSPAVTNAIPATSNTQPNRTPPPAAPAAIQSRSEPEPAPPAPACAPRTSSQIAPLLSLVKGFRLEDFKYIWSSSCLSEAEAGIVNAYPPLFDQNGGVRRRLRREREEEQRRMEQEVQAFQQPPALEADEDPEMSGSLQLGGEPEERQGPGQVQSAIHPPGHEGVLDQSFQFGGNSASAGSAERNLTQQQLLLQTLKPNAQGPYSANQPSNFQSFQQPSGATGHQRNASRYSFANDTASASTTVKPVANAKLMNQQSSMMPTTANTPFGAQQPHGQFYTSNVQGPPPGLKTTGTPPVSGNLTFGQGHGFATGGLQYGAGASRNQQDQYYRDLMRGGRDATAGGVDAKREFNSLPNYNSTHPNAAYPAGQTNAFSASTYPTLGAFGEGEKQRKKKGKKHRHANTSSSSGGGVVDAASDPTANHLLQTRLHQGAGGLSGGAFAGQATGAADDLDFPLLGHRTRQQSLAASLDESRRSTPPVPPGFENHESRRSTPAIPPGLSKPTGLPDLEGGSATTSRPSSRASLRRNVSTQIMPALPLRPGTPAQTATPSKVDGKEDLRAKSIEETPTKASKNAAFHSASELKTATSSQPAPSEQPVAESTETTSKAKVVDAKSDVVDKKEDPKAAPAGKAAKQSRSAKASAKAAAKTAEPEPPAAAEPPVTPVKRTASKSESTKKNHPGKLDITAAVVQPQPVKDVVSTPTEIATPVKTLRAAASTPSVKAPESPAGSVASPAIKVAPRTLRVLATPKAETPPPGNLTAPSLPSVLANKFPSRQPSVASINVPGTPSSEHISMSDNMSLASTSQSRANSPPPGAKVGSAPVRAKTKSQQKKERQERAKAVEQEVLKNEEEKTIQQEAPAQEAIVSRKKKAKKEKEPPKPKPKPTPVAEAPAQDNRASASDVKTEPEVPAKVEKENKPATPIKTAPTPPPAMPSPREPSPPPTPTALTAARLIADLKAHTPEIQKCIDSLFKVSNSSQFKSPQNMSAKDLMHAANWKPDLKVNLTKQEVDDLLKGKVPMVHYNESDAVTWDRGMITSSGAHLRALTKELESRFIELEKALRELPEEFKFRPSKPQNDMKFPSVDLEALKRQYENVGARGVSVMEEMVQDGAAMRKGAFMVDEASKYINGFVMPPVTPPPSAGGQQHGKTGGHHHHHHAGGQGHQSANVEPMVPSLEVAERQLAEAKKYADEKEATLRKQIKKNKRLLGIAT